MRSSSTKKNIIVAVIIFLLIGGLVSYLIITSEVKSKESEMEYGLEMKKSAYNNYIKSMNEINIARDVETVIRVIEESKEALKNLSDDEQLDGYYNGFEEGNEYIDTLKKSAIKNLNSAIPALYDSDITLPQFKSIEDIKYSEYMSDESKSILIELEARIYERSGVYIGMTREEVLRTKWGKPKDINRTITSNSIREQWVYYNKYLYFEDGILTTIQD